MKKSLLFLIIIFIAVFGFWASSNISAQFPNFEIYGTSSAKCEGKNIEHYPALWDFNYSITDGTEGKSNIYVSANICDVSGVSSAVAILKNSQGIEVDTANMEYIGENLYSATFLNKDSGNYSIEIFVADYIRCPDCTYTYFGENIVLNNEVCASANNAEICVYISFPDSNLITDFIISPSSTEVGQIINLSVSSSLPAGETIVFRDNDANLVLASVLTNSLGDASFSYKPAFSGEHTIQAIYNGNTAQNLAPGIKTATLTLTGNCASSSNATICINISFDEPWLFGWQYRKQIIISNTNINSDLTDFPLYVKISGDSAMANALSTGYDIRFTDSDGVSLLSYERESWSGGGGSPATADFWVKVPNLYQSPSVDQNKIYVYYGKAGAADGQNAGSVWSNNFEAVWHLEENGSPYTDSTSNGINSTAGTAPVKTAGVISSAQFFNGTSQYIDFGNKLDLVGSPLTFSAWVKADSWKNYDAVIDKLSSYGNYRFHVNSGGVVVLGIRNSSGTYQSMSSGSLSTGAWHYITAVYDNATHGKIFIDGVYSGQKTNFSITRASYSVSLRIGRATNNGVYYAGFIDEPRISSTMRDSSWIKFEYYNMSSASNELTWGNQESI